MSTIDDAAAVHYDVQGIDIRHDMIVVQYTDPAEDGKPYPKGTSQMIRAGLDPEVDQKVRELMDDIFELLDLTHIANRRPPATRRAGPPPD